MQVTLKAEFKEVERALGRLNGEIEKAASRALNDTAKQVRTQAVRRVQTEMSLRNQKYIKQSIVITKSSPLTLSASVIGTGKAVPLHNVKGSKALKRSGVKATYGGKDHHIQRGFKWNGAFFKRVGARRHPVVRLSGPSVPISMVKEVVTNEMAGRAQTIAVKRFDYWIGEALRRLGIRK